MKTIDVIRRSGRSLSQAKVRTFLTASAIAVGAFALTMTLAASNGAQAYTDKLISNNFNPSELIVALDPSALGQSSSSKPQKYDSGSYAPATSAIRAISTPEKVLNDSDLAKLRSQPGISQVEEGISPNVQYVSGVSSQKYIATVDTFGIDQSPAVVAGKLPSSLGTDQLLLPQAYVKSLGFSTSQEAVGKKVNLVVAKNTNAANAVFTFSIAAIYKPATTSLQADDSNLFYIGLPAARQLNDYSTLGTTSYHKYSYAYAYVIDGTNQAKLSKVENNLKSLGYSVTSEKDTQQFLNQVISVLRGIVAAFGVIALIASIFGIVNTMYISVLQRTREIGLMKALGMRSHEIGSLFRVEAAWIGFLGGSLGSLGAVAVGTIINPALTKSLNLDGSRLLIFEPLQIIILIIILIIIAIIAGLLPAFKASRLDPIDALRSE